MKVVVGGDQTLWLYEAAVLILVPHLPALDKSMCPCRHRGCPAVEHATTPHTRVEVMFIAHERHPPPPWLGLDPGDFEIACHTTLQLTRY